MKWAERCCSENVSNKDCLRYVKVKNQGLEEDFDHFYSEDTMYTVHMIVVWYYK